MTNKNYHCSIESSDYIRLDKREEGVAFIIEMEYNEISFDNPVIVLDKDNATALIKELQELLKLI